MNYIKTQVSCGGFNDCSITVPNYAGYVCPVLVWPLCCWLILVGASGKVSNNTPLLPRPGYNRHLVTAAPHASLNKVGFPLIRDFSDMGPQPLTRRLWDVWSVCLLKITFIDTVSMDMWVCIFSLPLAIWPTVGLCSRRLIHRKSQLILPHSDTKVYSLHLQSNLQVLLFPEPKPLVSTWLSLQWCVWPLHRASWTRWRSTLAPSMHQLLWSQTSSQG